MRLAITMLTAFVALGIAIEDTEPEPAGYGSCYEARPICVGGGSPTCMCTVTQRCYWVCR